MTIREDATLEASLKTRPVILTRNRLMADRGAAFCIYEFAGFLSPKEVTADFVYIRLHGPGDAHQGNCDTRSLVKWAGAISTWARQGLEVFCYFENDEAGYAAQNACSLQEMLA